LLRPYYFRTFSDLETSSGGEGADTAEGGIRRTVETRCTEARLVFAVKDGPELVRQAISRLLVQSDTLTALD